MNSVVTLDFYKIVFLAFERDGLREGLCTAVAITIHYSRFPSIPNYPHYPKKLKQAPWELIHMEKRILSVLHMKKRKFSVLLCSSGPM